MSVAAVGAGDPLVSPDLWPDLSAQLAGIDAQKRAQRGAAPTRTGGVARPLALLGWRPLGWAAVAAAAVLAIGLWNTPGTLEDEPGGSVLRYLDTGGRPVMVVDEEDVTIIWLM